MGVAVSGAGIEVEDVVVSVFVVMELSEVDAEGVESAHAVLSVSVAAQETSREGEDGREQSSMKRERRWGVGDVAMAIVVV